MKRVTFAALAMAAAAAPHNDNMRLPKSTRPMSGHTKTSSKEERYAWTSGSAVRPGKVLSRAERERRRDSGTGLDGTIDVADDRDDDDFTFSRLFCKARHSFEHWRFPGLAISERRDEDGPRHPINFQGLVVMLIALLIVFGTGYTFLEWLLMSTRAAAACTPTTTTEYIPVTTTVTYALSIVASAASSSSDVTTHSTIYSTSTLTSTLSVFPAMTSATVLSSSGGPSYFYSMVSGTTDWLNGVAPSSGASLTTGTTSVYLSPVSSLPAGAPESPTTMQPTASETETVTPPPYMSTIFQLSSPGTTITSTSTRYRTIEVSHVSSSSRSSYPGVGAAGWNSTGSAPSVAAPTDAAVTSTDGPSTYTEIHYWGTGNQTTSTSMRLITTTLHLTKPTTITLTSTLTTATDPASSSSSSIVAAANATSSLPLAGLTPTVPTSSVSSITASSLSVISAGSPSYDPPVFTPSASRVSSNGTLSAAATGMPDSSPPVSSPLNMSSSVVPANSSMTNGVTASSLASFPTNMTSTAVPTSATVGNSTTAAFVVPVTSTLSSGSGVTVVSETTSTTLGLSSSSPMTVSGYFVYNGTTTVPLWTGPGTGNPVPYSPATSALASLNANSSSLASVPSSNATISHSIQTSPPSALSTSPSVSVPIDHSSPVLSAISSVLSEMPGIDTSPGSLSAAPTTPGPSTSSTPSTNSSQLSPSSKTTSSVVAATITPSAPSSSSSPIINSTVRTTSSSAGANISPSSGGSSSSTFISSASLSPYSVPSSSLAVSNSSATKASSATATASSGCGEQGGFVLDFDTLPNFVPNNANQTDITQAPPAASWSPYHHLTFSNGYVYGPEPRLPYVPSSSPHMAVFLANGTGVTAKPARPGTSTAEPGEVGDGMYESSPSFWFNAYNGSFGCDSPEGCTMVITGYTYSPAAKDEIPTYTHNATITPCPGLISGKAQCQLHPIFFPEFFRSLSGIQMQAFSGNEEVMFFMDDLSLGWSNSSCAAGMKRQTHR